MVAKSSNNISFKLVLLGDAGQERFHALGPIYYRDADAALLVYDITSSETFDRVTKWVKELQQMAPGDITMTIAANKSDLVRSNKINIQEAESYATSIGARLFMTSAKTGTGIDEMFLDMAKRLMDKRREGTEGLLTTVPKRGLVIIDDEPDKEPPPRCCS